MLTTWRDRATTRTGHRPEDLVAATIADSHTEPVTAGQVSEQLVQAIGRDVLAGTMTRRSTWTRVNLLAETARATRTLRLATPADRHALHDRVVAAALAECVSLEAPELFTVPPAYTRPDGTSVFTRPGEHRYTATAVLDAEHRLLTACEDTTGPTARRVTTLDVIGRHHDQPTTAPSGPSPSTTTAPGTAPGGVRLAADQAAAVLAVATSGRRLDVLVGPAGTGKTTTLAGLRAAWEATHGAGSVIGLAPSATAAAELASRLGIACENTAKWLHETQGPGHLKRAERREWLEQQRGQVRTEHDPVRARALDTAIMSLHEESRRWSLHGGQLLIVDEASLAGTFALDTLTTQARAAGAKVLLVGDHAQLSAVDAGGAFHLLAERGRPNVLTSLWRFEQAWEAAATLALRAGNPRVLTTYEQHGRITAGPGEAMLEDAYTAWQADQEAGVPSILLAADAATVNALNTRAHNDRVTDGLVAPTGISRADGTTIGVGDRVLSRRNDRTLTTGGGFVRNGDLWDVVATHRDGSLTVTRTARDHRDGDDQVAGAVVDEEVRLPAGYVAEHVDLGYATTTHRAQGLTVTAAHLLAAPGMTREALYVGMTRGRTTNRVYVAIDRLDPACDNLPDPHHVPAGRDVLERILSTAGAELSAAETHARNLDEAGSLHRLTPIRETLTADAAARHWARALPGCGLTEAQVAAIETSPARDALFAALTRGHHAGYPMTDVLTRLAAEPVDDDGGADLGAVLADRVASWVDAHSPDPRDDHGTRPLEGLVDDGDPAADTLAQVDDLIRQRINALTQLAVLERPAWLASHGPEPDPGPQHEAWLAGIAARIARIDTLDPAARPHSALTAPPPRSTTPTVPAPERSLSR